MGSCCLGDSSFLPQDKIGSRINPFILLGRLTVLNEMYEQGKIIAAIEQQAESEQRDQTEEETSTIARHQARIGTLPAFVRGKPGDQGRQTPFQYLASMAHLCMTLAK